MLGIYEAHNRDFEAVVAFCSIDLLLSRRPLPTQDSQQILRSCQHINIPNETWKLLCLQQLALGMPTAARSDETVFSPSEAAFER